jgi:myo-inositol-1(or 4)-monophosphatase
VAREAASVATELIVGERPGVLDRANKSTATDEVTQMDRASEQVIRKVIQRLRPDDSIVGEEHLPSSGTSGITWVVDPIDGTTNYIYDHPGYAVSIAACLSGDGAKFQAGDRADQWMAPGGTLAAVVSDPTHGRTYSATLGGGADCNGVALRLPSTSPELGQSLVATGFGYDAALRGVQGAVVARILPSIRDIRRMGAAAVDLCSVASGRVDAYYERNLSPWDLAAGLLIATEAGAAAGSIDGGLPRSDSILVAHPARLPELQELLARAGAMQDP